MQPDAETPIRVTLLKCPADGIGADAIDEIYAASARVAIRQADKHTIQLEIQTGGQTHQFRFESALRRRGAGVCLRDYGDTPPGDTTFTPGYSTEIATYDLPAGSVHVEMMGRGTYWIGVRAGDLSGSLYAVARGARGSITLCAAALTRRS